MLACLWEHRQAEANEAIAAKLQEHARQNDRACGRRLNVRVGQPSVNRKHWHFNRKACEEGQPEPRLRACVKVILHQRWYVGRASIIDHPQHRNQHQDRAEQSVEEELIARVYAVIAAPNAYDEIHRDEARLKEDVKQEDVLRGEHADHQQFHQQESGHILANALGDAVPACKDTDRHQEHAQHDQHEGDAINAQGIAKPCEQISLFGKLPLRPTNFVIGPKHNAQCQIDQRGDQCGLACSLRSNKQTDDCTCKRHKQHD